MMDTNDPKPATNINTKGKQLSKKDEPNSKNPLKKSSSKPAGRTPDPKSSQLPKNEEPVKAKPLKDLHSKADDGGSSYPKQNVKISNRVSIYQHPIKIWFDS